METLNNIDDRKVPLKKITPFIGIKSLSDCYRQLQRENIINSEVITLDECENAHVILTALIHQKYDAEAMLFSRTISEDRKSVV